jgi:hypothetical protein
MLIRVCLFAGQLSVLETVSLKLSLCVFSNISVVNDVIYGLISIVSAWACVHKHVHAMRLGFNTIFLAGQSKSCHF